MEPRPQSVSIRQAMEIAFGHHQAGRLAEAERIYRKIIDAQPDNAEALDLLGVLAHQTGRNEIAVDLIERAIRLQPSNLDYLSDFGTACRALRRFDVAERSLRAALAIDAENARTHHELGIVLQEMGRAHEAIDHHRRAVAIDPGYADAHNNLGAALASLGRPLEAETSLREALALKPDFPEALCNLGIALRDLGRLEEAAACLRQALARRADFSAALGNLGFVLHALGRFDEAEAHLRRAIALNPGLAEDHNNLGNTLNELGRFQDAESALRRALELRPDFAEAHVNLANSLRALERADEAEKHLQRALALKPDHADAHNNLGALQQDLGRLLQAEQSYRQALRCRPGDVKALNNLANLLRNRGLTADAETMFRDALAASPGYAVCHSNLIFTLDLMERTDTREQQAERRRWNEQHARRYAGAIPAHRNLPDPQRKLRIGYVSADFRRQSACMIFGPVLLGHERSRFEVVCYSGLIGEDEVTARLRKAAGAWRSTVGMSDEALAAQIRRDGIDILVDLSAHMAGNRLLVFARKPAPVQVTAWGYANGTGLEAMDYFLADPVLVTREERQHFAEEVVDLPCCVCYAPPEYLPAVSSLPATTRGSVTFGCLNRIEKISERTIALWGRILAALPDAQLVVKGRGLDDPELKESFAGKLDREGIKRPQVRLLGHSAHAGQLKIYQQLDLQLDPFPHGGGVSTLEALWMGVPVVTLEGATAPSRLSASILTAAGMPEWIARSDEEYVGLAVEAAQDLTRLADVRKGLRARMASSVIGDTRGYTRAVEAAYREMWRRWCEQATSKLGGTEAPA